MDSQPPQPPNAWDEDTSQQFIDYGRYMVPDREGQMRRMAGLLAGLEPGSTLVELCCGEGLLAEVVLDANPEYTLRAFDGSTVMLERARRRLARFGGRFQAQPFDLAAREWRRFDSPIQAFFSSLAIHHLPGPEKLALFADLYRMLAPGGVLVIADILAVVGAAGKRLAADEWDETVSRRALELDGNLDAFDFFQREGWNIHRHLDPDDIDKPSPLFDQLKWLEAAGFAEIEVNWLLAGHAIFSARKVF